MTSPATTPPKGSVEEAAQALMARLSGTADTKPAPETPAPAEGAPEDPPQTLEAAPEPDAGAEVATETPTEPETPVYTVRVEGEDVEVPLDELLRGYSRTADYTRKTQAVAEARKAAEAEAQSVREARNQYAGLLDQVQTALQALTPQEPNWHDLRATLSPQDYATAQDTWREQSRRLDALKQERQRVAQQQADDLAKQVEAFKRAEQDKLINAVPEWRDPTKAETERQQLLAYAKARGFTEQDLGTVQDHRLWLVLRDAQRWHQASQRPTPKPGLKTASPGAPQAKPKTAATDAAMATLKKTGRQQDAAAAILAKMGDRL